MVCVFNLLSVYRLFHANKVVDMKMIAVIKVSYSCLSTVPQDTQLRQMKVFMFSRRSEDVWHVRKEFEL